MSGLNENLCELRLGKRRFQQTPVLLTDCSVLCAAGDTAEILSGLQRTPQETMSYRENFLSDRGGYFGVVKLQQRYRHNKQSRTCRMLHCLSDQIAESIERLKSNYHPNRIAVIIGTTTSGIREAEAARSTAESNYHHWQEISILAEDLGDYCGVRGPRQVVSTACTSGAKALGLARMMIQAGWCDAAISGACESLCKLACRGFDALESYAENYSRPFQARRDGINIGEGGALFTLEKGEQGIVLAGFSEASDAFHESAPDPQGIGAGNAICAALDDAGIDANRVDYINLHGTGTRLNDAMEAKVVQKIFGETVPASSTKQVTGHVLGAAGAVEAAIVWLMINGREAIRLPPHHGAEDYDPELPRINLVRCDDETRRRVDVALSASFAFGGHNVALVLARNGG